MNKDNFSSLEQARLSRILAYNEQRIKRLEAFLNGQPLGSVRFADAAFTTAKILELSADKLSTGQLSVDTQFLIGSGDGYIEWDGDNQRLVMYNDNLPQLVVGPIDGVNTVRIALPGYNALTDTDPNHFALFVDEATDYILIKEKARGSSTVSSAGSATIAHGLAYVPFVLCFYESASGVYRKIHGSTAPASGLPYFEVDDTNLVLRNPTGGSKVMKYYIFYDDVEPA